MKRNDSQVHNNYFFLSKLSQELQQVLPGAELVDCFSQNKDELVLGFLTDSNREFFIVASLTASFSSLYFPGEYFRARKNSITLFDEILRRKVLNVKQVSYERLFVLEFTDGLSLGFKLFGNRANVILSRKDEVLKIFKSSLKQDRTFSLENAGREMDLSFEYLKHLNYEVKKAVPVLGDVPLLYLQEKDFFQKGEEDKKYIWDVMISTLLGPKFHITEVSGKFLLSLLPIGNIHSTHTSAIEAINAFYQAHYRYNFLEAEKQKVFFEINRKLKEGRSYMEKCLLKIRELDQETSPSQLADIIMANLHVIPPGAVSVRLFDFYSNNELEVRLKKDLSPQKYAELLYKKAKGRPREMEMLKGQIEKKESELVVLESDKQKLTKIESYKELEPLKKKYLEKSRGKVTEDEKFKVYEVMSFKILVGRNADNNEELTQRFAKKNDLWLHARDVAGSHVVIKHQAGKGFPKPVIEAAASLAAYYSKRKNESLCPVIYTEKKFVRKIKGTPAGQMKVEKENVMMVVPRELTVDS